MTFIDLLIAQLTDLFRIGLLVALVITTMQTRAQTGRVIPLAVGVVFVAFLIATTTGADDQSATTTMKIGVGLIANVIILAVILAAQELFLRLTTQKTPD